MKKVAIDLSDGYETEDRARLVGDDGRFLGLDERVVEIEDATWARMSAAEEAFRKVQKEWVALWQQADAAATKDVSGG